MRQVIPPSDATSPSAVTFEVRPFQDYSIPEFRKIVGGGYATPVLFLGVAREPWLIVMDEPTNHLDLVSIRCLETALCDCPAGLFVVSHDRLFLEHVVCKRWVLTPEDGGFELCQVDGR